MRKYKKRLTPQLKKNLLNALLYITHTLLGHFTVFAPLIIRALL